MINQFLEEATEQSTTVTSSKSAGRSSTMLRNGYLKIGYQLWQQEEEPRKGFNISWILTLPDTFRRAIQGHSGDNAIDLALQDGVLLPKGFTEYTYHVGNASELNSILRNGLLSVKRGRQAVFFTTVNPMDDGYGMEETPSDLTKPRIAPYNNTWQRFQHTVFWCNLKVAQEKGLQFYQTRSHAVVLCNTQFAACIEKWYVWKHRMSSTRRFA